MARDRTELLSAALTIWRWGRLELLPQGRPLGSFETWCRWVRDPLVALGCRDPVERIGEAKERDGRRQSTAELFNTWWERHGDHPIAVRDLHPDVRQLVDAQDRGRQYISAQLEKLTGTRIASLVLTRQAAAGKWGVATYAMKCADGPDGHRGHRGHRSGPDGAGPVATCRDEPRSGLRDPMPPMTPMPAEGPAPFERNDRWPDDEWQAAFQERAAILEFDGHLSRIDAEARATEELGISGKSRETAK